MICELYSIDAKKNSTQKFHPITLAHGQIRTLRGFPRFPDWTNSLVQELCLWELLQHRDHELFDVGPIAPCQGIQSIPGRPMAARERSIKPEINPGNFYVGSPQLHETMSKSSWGVFERFTVSHLRPVYTAHKDSVPKKVGFKQNMLSPFLDDA